MTVSCLGNRQDATPSTTTIAATQDSCQDHISRELAVPTPPPGATSLRGCSFQYTDPSSADAMGDYYTQVDSFFHNMDSKISSLLAATSCDEPITASYSGLCTGNITVAHISRSTGIASIGVTNAVIHQPLELPTDEVVLDWATVSTTTSEATTKQTDDQNSGASGFKTGVMAMAMGVAALGCAWQGL